MTAMFATIAVGEPEPPMAGTPPRPAICSGRTPPCWSGLAIVRVSRIRLGVTLKKTAPTEPVASVDPTIWIWSLAFRSLTLMSARRFRPTRCDGA